ncbi:MAG: hypothetical protein OXU81_15825 [Gammaproteobacteria bacterium]|nr:hypothetical protein [Gammaproteobacteria bacterium]
MPALNDLETLIARLAAIDFSQTSEQDTRERAVNPVIDALGWDTFDSREVAREYPVRGGKVDYCLRGAMDTYVLIEVKRAGTELSEHQEQLLRYAFAEGAPMAALTDGLAWWLYLPRTRGSWEQRRFARIDLREQGAADVASVLCRFLRREGLVGGTALDEARREFQSQERDRRVRDALQPAWERMIGDPQGRLRDLFAETVEHMSGYLPDRETVTEFLQGVSGTGSPAVSSRTERTAQRPPAKSFSLGRRASVPPAAFWLDDDRYPVTRWRKLWIRLCEQVAKESGQAFSERVAILRGRNRPYFSVSGTDLRNPLPVPGAGLYVEGHLNSRMIERIAREMLHAVRGADSGGNRSPIPVQTDH